MRWKWIKERVSSCVWTQKLSTKRGSAFLAFKPAELNYHHFSGVLQTISLGIVHFDWCDGMEIGIAICPRSR